VEKAQISVDIDNIAEAYPTSFGEYKRAAIIQNIKPNTDIEPEVNRI
jgi:hypothetical protein